MMSSEPDFCCIVCQRAVSTRWNAVGRYEELAPICCGCERTYSEGMGKPAAGSFRDRRNAMRIFALSEALYTAAMHIQWSTRHAAA